MQCYIYALEVTNGLNFDDLQTMRLARDTEHNGGTRFICSEHPGNQIMPTIRYVWHLDHPPSALYHLFHSISSMGALGLPDREIKR